MLTSNLMKIEYADLDSIVIDSELLVWHTQIYLIYAYQRLQCRELLFKQSWFYVLNGPFSQCSFTA